MSLSNTLTTSLLVLTIELAHQSTIISAMFPHPTTEFHKFPLRNGKGREGKERRGKDREGKGWKEKELK